MAEQSNVDSAALEARYPYLLDYTDDDLQPLIANTILETEDDVSEAQFGDLRDRAVTALSAHKMLMHARFATGDSSAAQRLSAYSADGVSGTFVVQPPEGIPAEDEQFYTTQPGVDYMALCRRMLSGARLV